MRPRKFLLPCITEGGLTNNDGKVVVISIIGKSNFHAKGCKTEMIGTDLLVDLIDHPKVNNNTFVRKKYLSLIY